MSRIRPIGDDDDGDCADGPQSVGTGCAALTSVSDPADGIALFVKAALMLHKADAQYVKIGEAECSWFKPEPAKSE